MSAKERDNERFARLNQAWLRNQGHDLRLDGWGGTNTTEAWREETGFDGAPDRAAEPAADRSLRLPPDQYLPDTSVPKDLVVLHHTAGGSAKSTFDWWNTTPERIGTAYIVERDGSVIEPFDPRAWAFHLGVKGTRGSIDRRSVGIEIASEGGLTEREGKLYAFGVVSERTEYRGEVFEWTGPQPWRGFRHFAAYTPAAIEAVIELVNHLCARFDVVRRYPVHEHVEHGFTGVAAHHHFRSDKSDVHAGFPWGRLADECQLERFLG